MIRAAVFIFIAALSFMSGCDLMDAFVAAEYKLPPRLTAILVDDPQNQLGYPGAPSMIESMMADQLAEKKVESTFVDQARMNKLRSELRHEFGSLPTAEVGRRVGAEQIIAVRILSAGLVREPGMMRPRAIVSVKVIDCRSGKVLFPAGAARRIDIQALHRPMDPDDRSQVTLLQRQLFARIARDAARLFHSWQRRVTNPSHPFER